ncbi:transglycosylase [Actinoplanes xinjiangensis]|uniref:Transglycosylase n=2 Tax=Actinoplanes xinjiangensis TaxID=512350 RepID=A0A316ETS0_9ACTN|nr:transglycosylase [Actinoplanes xinjiangensis]
MVYGATLLFYASAGTYCVAMTIADMARPANEPVSVVPARRRGQRVAVGVSMALLLVAGGTVASTYYYDSVPLVESGISYPVVAVTELSPAVVNAFVAAVDADFYDSGDSLITRRYAVVAAGADEESGLRTRILANKAESSYTKEEILDRYLNRADYGRGAVGLVAAARTYFNKPAAQLTVAEAALLAVQLHPDRPTPRDGWNQVLDTMVERGWLAAAERSSLTFPG